MCKYMHVHKLCVDFAAKPIMFYSSKTIIKDRSHNNIMLTCAVKYSYPTAVLTWNIMTESSSAYSVVKENSTRKLYPTQ